MEERKGIVMDIAEMYELKMLEKEVENCQKFIEILNYFVVFDINKEKDYQYLNEQISIYQKRLDEAKEELDYENKSRGIC